MMRTEKLTMLALGLCGFTCFAGCGQQADTGDTPSASDESVGKVDLDLQLANGSTLNSASYIITGPGGFSRSGSIDVSQSSSITALIGGIPAGTGYSITISGTSTDASTSCSGSAGFSIVVGQTASVTVPVLCREASRTGSVLVNGTLNICPTVDGIGANPAEVHVGGTIALSALAHDSDAGTGMASRASTMACSEKPPPRDRKSVV